METPTVSKKKLPTSIGQLPDYQGRIFLEILLKRGMGKWKTGTKPNLNPNNLVARFSLLPVPTESRRVGENPENEVGTAALSVFSFPILCFFSHVHFPVPRDSLPFPRFPFPAPFNRLSIIVTSNILVLELKQLVLCSFLSPPENSWSIKDVLIVIISFWLFWCKVKFFVTCSC